MKVTIGGTTYTQIKTITFEPEMDLSLNSIPINEFVAEIVTDDAIQTDQYAILYDDRDNIWAKYWITAAKTNEENMVKVTAKSPLYFLDFWGNLPESKDINITFESLVETMAMGIPVDFEYSIQNSLKSKIIGNYFPEESPRERLHKACFTAGAYIRSFFSDKLEFVELSSAATLIPANKTYWQPTIEYNDYVTAVKVKSYVYDAEGNKTSEQWNTANNSNAPVRTMANEVSVEGISFVNSSNAQGILTRMSAYHFSRGKANVSVVNNADYKPGQKVRFYLTESKIMAGYIEKCGFSFGLQAKSDLTIAMLEDVPSTKLIIRYMYGDRQIGRKVACLPVGYQYQFVNQNITTILDGQRCNFAPAQATVSGTMASGTNERTVQYNKQSE